MNNTRETLFAAQAAKLGVSFDEEIRAGANYDVAVKNGDEIYVSGQIPRVQNAIAVTGRVGETVSLVDGRRAAAICALRATAVLRQTLGSLDRVKRLLRLNVYIQSASDFTQQSEVADAASEILYAIFAPSAGHARTAVGVYQLPKNAAVELDLVAAIHRR